MCVSPLAWACARAPAQNVVSGKTTWLRPRFFFEDNSSAGIALPPPSREYKLACATCATKIAEVWCVACAAPFCRACYPANTELPGLHKDVPIDVCVECEFQVRAAGAFARASRSCQRRVVQHSRFCVYGVLTRAR